MSSQTSLLTGFETEFRRYRSLAERTLETLSWEDLQRGSGQGNNSVAILMQHIGGNLNSRFSDFLTSDGEKSWRNRDQEFEDRGLPLPQLREIWDGGWQALEQALGDLKPEDLTRTITVRGVPFEVAEALARALGHISYHVGQIVLQARLQKGTDWQSLSIPPGGSAAYNRDPNLERGPAGPDES